MLEEAIQQSFQKPSLVHLHKKYQQTVFKACRVNFAFSKIPLCLLNFSLLPLLELCSNSLNARSTKLSLEAMLVWEMALFLRLPFWTPAGGCFSSHRQLKPVPQRKWRQTKSPKTGPSEYLEGLLSARLQGRQSTIRNKRHGAISGNNMNSVHGSVAWQNTTITYSQIKSFMFENQSCVGFVAAEMLVYWNGQAFLTLYGLLHPMLYQDG